MSAAPTRPLGVPRRGGSGPSAPVVSRARPLTCDVGSPAGAHPETRRMPALRRWPRVTLSSSRGCDRVKSPQAVATERRSGSDESGIEPDAVPTEGGAAPAAGRPHGRSWRRPVAALRRRSPVVPRGRARPIALIVAVLVALGGIAQIVVHQVTALPADAA